MENSGMVHVRVGKPETVNRQAVTVRRLIGQRVWSRALARAMRWISLWHQRRHPLFDSIEIETINRCNSRCSFCPANVDADPRPLARMSDELFRKIIDDLAALRFHDHILFHSNNEPFLDKKLVPRIAYARQKCPHALLGIYTNGTPLNPALLIRALDAGLDEIVIDNYSDDLELHANVHACIAELEKPEHAQHRHKVEVRIRPLTEVLSNRGGSAPNKSTSTFHDYRRYLDVGCPIPFRQMVVRPTGEVSLCCNDALGEVTLGDLRRQSVAEVWNSEAFRKLRAELLRAGRRNLKLCNACDVAMPRFEFIIARSRGKRAAQVAAQAGAPR
jgi:radical SAM protein with 4Fe4S-binding SPASM domain